MKRRLQKKRSEMRKKSNVDNLLKVHLGSLDAVSQQHYLGKKSYIYKCPECNVFISDKLARHLENKHQYTETDAKFRQSKMRVLYTWCINDKHGKHLPLPCEPCSEWHQRLDTHLKTNSFHSHITSVQIKETVETMREKYWENWKRNPSETSDKQMVCSDEQETMEKEQNEVFVRRAVYEPVAKLANMNINYTPGSSKALTDEMKIKYKITHDDFLTIYFNNAEELLSEFQKQMASSGHTKDNAVQHRNQVELIWSTLDERMQILPQCALGNIHLFRDFYHRPSFQMINKKGGVQANTLRARYVSFGFFLQFLRKQQIFTGMSRSQMTVLNQAIEDFNKELNPLIKQRKVEVRQMKRENLLFADHFIRYGRSSFIQKMIKMVSNSRKGFTKKFAINFRDYLITSLVINNGLRASNVIELTLKDVKEASVVTGYEGHRVLTNQKYKTSTIYGEKFIVASNQLYDHLMFYIENLRPIVLKTLSSRLFVPSSDSSKMSQTNVSSSLTSSFTNANVLNNKEYPRMSCTRIRCALATFACNDGGFEMGYFAKHFMKNWESTTALHYNLLANRRHALNIAMKLYQSFNDGGTEVAADNAEADKILQDIKLYSRNVDKDKVIDWLKKNDSSLTTTEIEEFSGALDSLKNTSHISFYGNNKKVCSSSEIEACCFPSCIFWLLDC